MLRSNLYDYNDAYIIVKKRISGTGTNRKTKKLTFKNNAPFRSCVSKINTTFGNNSEDFDIVTPI